MMRDVLVEHKKHCQNRIVNCVALACQQKVPLSSLLSHLDSDHVKVVFIRVKGGENIAHFVVDDKTFTEDTTWKVKQLHFDNKYFYLECCWSKEGLWNIWVYMLETKQDESENYLCEISINSAQNKDELLFGGRPSLWTSLGKTLLSQGGVLCSRTPQPGCSGKVTSFPTG
jgi:hypothetical protein